MKRLFGVNEQGPISLAENWVWLEEEQPEQGAGAKESAA